VIDNLEITATAETLVERLNLSGFIGFDFILDAAGHAWLLEMNPRVTSTSHLCVGDINLSAALWKRLTGSQAELGASRIQSELAIALFPLELQRCLHSPYLAHVYHDVPWEHPEFVDVCLRSALRLHSFKRALDRLLEFGPHSPQDEQTSKAAGDIGQQITSIQTATQESVSAIADVSGRIERLSGIASTIAAAVEEQGAATQTIFRNLQQTAHGTQQVSSNVSDVQRGTSEPGAVSSEGSHRLKRSL
jgi:hypothetical protein